MKITVKLFASFRDNRFKVEEREYPEGTVPRTIMEELGITEEEMGIVLINGRHVSLDDPLQEGHTLAMFPLVGGG
ncbi:MoaD/ThiS family protein [Geomonas sp. RF6]|uniref:MoaD/ThiS family protein n=1 Tax=Geomonas sp. RF6 TaxID=2897342 RepID=UPI001E551B3D|nr:MoaD/ThiS family protein [Geomonas sp. RF6]UFS72612.1 MoaD/ThiS family protein [Geomonas sp. RF6]